MNPDMPPIPLETLLANVEGMRRLAHRLVLDPALAEDVAQDAVLVALSKGPRHRRNLRGWLNGIVRNVARESHRSASRRRRYEGAAALRSQPFDRAGQAAEQKRLLDAVSSLAEPYRDTIWQRYFEDRPPRVIAREAAISVETVQTRLKRARAMLRTKLDAVHAGDRRAWALALAPLAASGTSWVLPTLIGGALVATKTKVGALVALVLLAAGGLWWASPVDEPSGGTGVSLLPPERTAQADVDAAGGELQGRKRATDRDPMVEEEGARRFTAQVVDEAERPLAGVQIRVGLPEVEDLEGMRVVGQSKGDGTFAIVAPEGASDFRVVASAPGRLDAVARVRPEEKGPLVLRLPAVPTYVFRLLDRETDQPLADVRCDLRRIQGHLMWSRTFRSNKEGIVALPNPTADELDYRIFVRITHPGYRPLLELRRPARASGYGTPAQPRDVYLRRAPRIVFEVRDPEGRPAADVRVRVWAGNPTLSTVTAEWSMATIRGFDVGLGGSGVVLGDARTDDAGRAVFHAGPQNLSWFALASGDGLSGLAYGSPLWNDDDLEGVIINMETTVRIVGRVTDGAGHPVARARVECTPWFIAKRMRKGGRVPTLPDECHRLWRTTTNEAGEYELLAVPLAAAPAELSVSTWRGDLGMAHASVRPATVPNETQRIDLVLEPKHEVRAVRVVDAEGAPLAGALVTFANMMPGMLTDESGVARLVRYRGVTGPYRAFKSGYVIGSTEGEGLPAEGQTTIVLRRGHSLRGRVLDLDGNPRGAYVDVYAPEVADLPERERGDQLHSPTWYGRARADTGGHFRLDDVPAGPYFIRFWYGTRRAGKRHTVMGELEVAGDELVELRLPETEPSAEKTGVVEGAVIDEDGRVLTSHGLSLRGQEPPLQPTLNGRRFRFEDVPPGEWRLQVSADGGAKQTEVFVRVRPGETTQVRVVVGQAVTLRGRLVGASGKGIPGTRLHFYRAGISYPSGRSRPTDTDGRFEIKNLLAGRYRVRVHGHAEGDPLCTSDAFFVLLAGSEQELVIRAQPAGTLTLTLDDDRFLPHSKDWYSNRNSAEGQRSVLTWVKVVTDSGEELKDFGLFRGSKLFDHPLAPGTYELVIKTWREGAFRRSFPIKAGEDTVVPVILEK